MKDISGKDWDVYSDLRGLFFDEKILGVEIDVALSIFFLSYIPKTCNINPKEWIIK